MQLCHWNMSFCRMPLTQLPVGSAFCLSEDLALNDYSFCLSKAYWRFDWERQAETAGFHPVIVVHLEQSVSFKLPFLGGVVKTADSSEPKTPKTPKRWQAHFFLRCGPTGQLGECQEWLRQILWRWQEQNGKTHQPRALIVEEKHGSRCSWSLGAWVPPSHCAASLQTLPEANASVWSGNVPGVESSGKLVLGATTGVPEEVPVTSLQAEVCHAGFQERTGKASSN